MPEFQGGGGAERANLSCLELLFDHRSLRGSQRAVMGTGDGFAGKFIQRACQALGNLAAVDEQDGRIARPNNFEQAADELRSRWIRA